MHLIKIALLLSFLALCQKSQVQAAISSELDHYLRCLEVVTDAGALMIENSITAISLLSDCVDFQPKLKLTGSILRFIRVAHQFGKKAIYDRPECLVQTFTTGVGLIRPIIAKFDSLRCFDE
ncbi:accessory gland protein Acp53Ea [Drosophila mauritiana]|nr:accessory gland protein Acp53Ea [Drosophila mauritiana]AAT49174.1 ACP53C14A [Drosophila simulans]AAT49178.1 ACP53C14A [Drosophila simulans]AAT49179.1 ACP53C14A [Drosophila simulans]AAT49180.1 ACP53C14A [Drosophila simulans]AIZ50447.1 Acp53C14a [Drosophila simulans]